MTKLQKFRVYEYPLKDESGNTYYGSYTIKEGIQPLKFNREKLVDEFEATVKA